MAKRMKSKIQPAVMKLRFQLDDGNDGVVPSGTTKTYYIDISQCASIVNRRFYRQGLNWAVGSMKLITPQDATFIVQKLPNTWIMSNSWEKGFRAWQKMIKNAIDDTEQQSLKGKFLDFKVYADKHHAFQNKSQKLFRQNLLPVHYEVDDVGQTTTVTKAAPGEWIPATLEMPVTRDILTLPAQIGETAEYQIIATGDNYPLDSNGAETPYVSLIQGYANSRALPSVSDPNVPADSNDVSGVTPENWLGALFNEGLNQDSGVLEDISEFDRPPYPFEDTTSMMPDTSKYPGGGTQMPGLETHAYETVTTTTVGGQTMIEGGNFPCGLIAVHFSPTTTSTTAGLEISLVPGTHRGYLAEPMTEM